MELALSRVINGLLPLGMTHSIAVLKGEAIIRDRIDPSVRIHCLHAGARDPGVPLRLKQLIDRERPTVIHCRNLGAWPEIAVARLLARPRVPLVFSFHGLAEARPVSWRWRMLSRLLARLTSRLFTVSAASRQFLVEHIGLRGAAIEVIPNGVDTARFGPPGGPRPAAEVLVVGTVGSLLPVKNQELLVRACATLIGQGTRLRLEIAGEGPARQDLQRVIDALGIADHVVLRGQVADIPGFLHSLDLFVLPSDSEAHPNALSEAMACGLPCIASRVGGIPEIVDEGRAARLFPRGDEAALTEALRALALDADARRALGQAACQLVAERYSMQVMLQRYAALYGGLSGSQAAR